MIETDAEKSVRLKVLAVDNARLLQKRRNQPMRPETVAALDNIVCKTRKQAQRNLKESKQKISAPNSLLKTADDVNKLGFMERTDFKIKNYQTTAAGCNTPESHVWNITRSQNGLAKTGQMWNTNLGTPPTARIENI